MQHIIFTTNIGNTLKYGNSNKMYRCPNFTDSIFYQIEQTAKFCRYLGLQIFSKLNLPMTMDEFIAMDVMTVHGEICQRELAKLILKDRSNTGRVLNSLEEKGFIKRFADIKNNRLVRRTRITPKGKKATEEVTIVLKEYINKLPEVFSKEDKDKLESLIIQFRESLEKVVEMKI